MAPPNKLFQDVVSFWKAQLNYSVRKLQKSLAKSKEGSLNSSEPSIPSEHEVYCHMCGISDTLQRIYIGSDAFYFSLVSDGFAVPISAICQVRRPSLHDTPANDLGWHGQGSRMGVFVT